MRKEESWCEGEVLCEGMVSIKSKAKDKVDHGVGFVLLLHELEEQIVLIQSPINVAWERSEQRCREKNSRGMKEP